MAMMITVYMEWGGGGEGGLIPHPHHTCRLMHASLRAASVIYECAATPAHTKVSPFMKRVHGLKWGRGLMLFVCFTHYCKTPASYYLSLVKMILYYTFPCSFVMHILYSSEAYIHIVYIAK